MAKNLEFTILVEFEWILDNLASISISILVR